MDNTECQMSKGRITENLLHKKKDNEQSDSNIAIRPTFNLNETSVVGLGLNTLVKSVQPSVTAFCGVK